MAISLVLKKMTVLSKRSALILVGLLTLTNLNQGLAAEAGKESKGPENKTGFALRVDSVGQKKQVGNAPATQSQTMAIKTARMLMTGSLNQDFSYTLRLDVKNTIYASDQVASDGTLPALDRAFIEHRLSDVVAVKIGRMPLMTGSIENDYSSMDRYNESYSTELLGKLLPITTGIETTATFGTHSFTLAAFDGVQETPVAYRGLQKGGDLAWALGYRSSLLGGLVKPIVSFNKLARIRAGQGNDRDDKVTYTAAGAGAQLSYAHIDWDLEYDVFTRPAFTSHTFETGVDKKVVATAVKNKEEKLKTVVTQVAYNWRETNLRPFAKISKDIDTQDGDEALVALRSAIGIEYRPAVKGLRYHGVMVNKRDDETKAGVKTRTNTRQYIVGVAAKI